MTNVVIDEVFEIMNNNKKDKEQKRMLKGKTVWKVSLMLRKYKKMCLNLRKFAKIKSPKSFLVLHCRRDVKKH